MAYTGFRKAGFAVRTASAGVVSYGELQELKQGVKAEIKVSKVDGKLMAFDTIAEQEKYISGATVTFECGYLTLEQESMLLGHTLSEDNKNITVSMNDVAPDVAFYSVAKKKCNGVVSYTAIVLLKGIFGDSDITMQTAEEGSVTFGTTSIEGTFSADEDASDVVLKKGEFDSVEDAMAFVKTTLGKTEGTEIQG